jgi:hypothetical protein
MLATVLGTVGGQLRQVLLYKLSSAEQGILLNFVKASEFRGV